MPPVAIREVLGCVPHGAVGLAASAAASCESPLVAAAADVGGGDLAVEAESDPQPVAATRSAATVAKEVRRVNSTKEYPPQNRCRQGGWRDGRFGRNRGIRSSAPVQGAVDAV